MSIQNRRGFFKVTGNVLRSVDQIAPVLTKMVVTHIDNNVSRDEATYFAYSELFEEIPPDVEAPEYFIITKTDGWKTTIREVTAERVRTFEERKEEYDNVFQKAGRVLFDPIKEWWSPYNPISYAAFEEGALTRRELDSISDGTAFPATVLKWLTFSLGLSDREKRRLEFFYQNEPCVNRLIERFRREFSKRGVKEEKDK